MAAYIWRRGKIIYLIKNSITKGPSCVADFGCGDGWYIKGLKKSFPYIGFTGIDSSKEMLNIVTGYGLNLTLQRSFGGSEKFDLIFTVATLAHIDDLRVVEFFNEARDHLTENGRVIICEQSAPKRYTGATYIKRLENEYRSIAESCGFEKSPSFLIDYAAHRWFERRIASLFYDKLKTAEFRKK